MRHHLFQEMAMPGRCPHHRTAFQHLCPAAADPGPPCPACPAPSHHFSLCLAVYPVGTCWQLACTVVGDLDQEADTRRSHQSGGKGSTRSYKDITEHKLAFDTGLWPQVESVATTLALAEQNHAEELKRVCLEYVSKHLSLVIASEGYQHMVSSCPQLQVWSFASAQPTPMKACVCIWHCGDGHWSCSFISTGMHVIPHPDH